MASKSTTLNPYNYTLTASFTERALTDENNQNNQSTLDLLGTFQANGSWWETSNWPSALILSWYDNKTETEREIKRIEFYGLNGAYDSKTISETINVTHKDDGTLKGYVKVYFEKGQTSSGFAPNSGGVQTDLTDLTTIPRHFSEDPVISLSSNSNTSLTINWSTSETCDLVKYHLDDGEAVNVFSGSSTSGSFTIDNLSPHSSHEIYVECRRKDSQLSSNSNTLNVSTTNKTMKVKIDGTWKEGTPFIKVNGSWKEAEPYYKVNGNWKRII